MAFCSATCKGRPGLTHLILHGDIRFYLFVKISLTLVEIFSLNIRHLRGKYLLTKRSQLCGTGKLQPSTWG